MIDPSFVDVTDAEIATVSLYPPTMEELERNIAKLKNDLELAESSRDGYAAMYTNLQQKVDQLEFWIRDQYDYIDEEITQSLVDIFCFEITKEYDVQITVTFTGTVEAPLNFDMDTVEDQFEFSAQLSYYADGLQADLMEDNVKVDWSEN